jgi:hypothetical protein
MKIIIPKGCAIVILADAGKYTQIYINWAMVIINWIRYYISYEIICCLVKSIRCKKLHQEVYCFYYRILLWEELHLKYSIIVTGSSNIILFYVKILDMKIIVINVILEKDNYIYILILFLNKILNLI